jgi:hypothetical protein
VPLDRECDGCGEPGADERLWLEGPLGLCAVRVHRVRSCAEQARVAQGGGRFVRDGEDEPLPPLRPPEDRLMRAVQGYVADWRRWHSTERVGP